MFKFVQLQEYTMFQRKNLAIEARNPVLLSFRRQNAYGPYTLSAKYNDPCPRFCLSINMCSMGQSTKHIPTPNDFHWTK